jgi:hypothetical protein
MTQEFNDILGDQFDIRDVIARYEELESERENFVIGAPDGTEVEAPEQWAEENPDEADELTQMEKFLEEVKGYGGDEQWRGDWYPVGFIAESYFTEAMKELCEDIGDFPNGVPSYYVIDWEATARNLKVDYSEVEIAGVTYLYR